MQLACLARWASHNASKPTKLATTTAATTQSSPADPIPRASAAPSRPSRTVSAIKVWVLPLMMDDVLLHFLAFTHFYVPPSGEDGGCDLTCKEEETENPTLADCQPCPVGTFSANGYIPRSVRGVSDWMLRGCCCADKLGDTDSLLSHLRSARNILDEIIIGQEIGAGTCSICPGAMP